MRKPFVVPDERQALERIASRCAKSELCEADVRRKLAEWKQCGDAADRIVEQLRAGGFIDDARFCRAFVEDKWRFNRWGKIKIRMALQQKNLRGPEVEEALEDVDSDEYREVLVALLQEKGRTLRDCSDYERYQKLIRFALGRGFETDIIKECLSSEIES